MTYPKTYRAFRRSKTPFPRTISISEETLPDTLGSHDVVIRIHAVALNYRDKAMLEEGKYPVPVEDGGISASDCAAEVVALGDKVTDFVVGDHVAPTINLANLSDDDRDADAQPLGGDATGVLREYALFEDKYLVKLPKHISWEEAATVSFVRYRHSVCQSLINLDSHCRNFSLACPRGPHRINGRRNRAVTR